MVKVHTCKACGHPIAPPGVLGALTPLQRRIFQAIERAGPAGVASPSLMSIVYADDPNGGPMSTNIIAVAANKMRARIAPFGLTLRSKLGRGGYYVLEKMKEETDATHR